MCACVKCLFVRTQYLSNIKQPAQGSSSQSWKLVIWSVRAEAAPLLAQKPRAERTAEEQAAIEEEDAAAAQELFCLCQQPDDPEAPRDFVQCDKCEQWFHPECVNTTAQVTAGPALRLI